MIDKYILDACALIALLNEESGAEVVEEILIAAQSGKVSVTINKLNLLEVYYDLYRKYGVDIADDLLDIPHELGILVQAELTEDVFKEAGRLKATYRISIADSVALAEASASGGALLTSDHHEFDLIEKSEKITIQWIR